MFQFFKKKDSLMTGKKKDIYRWRGEFSKPTMNFCNFLFVVLASKCFLVNIVWSSIACFSLFTGKKEEEKIMVKGK